MSHRTIQIDNEDAAERVLRKVAEERHGRVELPSAEQVAMVLRALSDMEHNRFMLSDTVQNMSTTHYASSNWNAISGLNRYFAHLAENVEHTVHEGRYAA